MNVWAIEIKMKLTNRLDIFHVSVGSHDASVVSAAGSSASSLPSSPGPPVSSSAGGSSVVSSAASPAKN